VADPAHADDYRRRAETYDRELAALDRDVRSRLDALPGERRKVITSHDAFQYFGRAYGIDFLAPVGLSTESEPSAGEVAALIRRMRDEGIHALFVENVTDPRLVAQLAREAGAVIGGRLYSDSLSGPAGPASTYLDMFRHNVGEIAKAVMIGPRPAPSSGLAANWPSQRVGPGRAAADWLRREATLTRLT